MIDRTFVDNYDWQGRLLDEPDDDEPILRRHCVKCGAFLPKAPKEVKRMVPAEWDYTYENGEVSGIVVHREEVEIDCSWDCKKCGYSHDCYEMYG